MGMLFWPTVIVVLIAGLCAGWAVHRDHDARYIERRARWIARNELTPPAPARGEVIEAELLYAPSVRLDRPEVTR
ncbi:MAG TPA: hypothetical protein VFW64_02580 [Pseudonocardiaceae bacterium]|nr:hypothetical protein [Pseudonocardiaceae bacterium]